MLDKEVFGVVYSHFLQVNNFNMMNYRQGIIRTTKDRLYLMPTVVYFPKNSFLIKLVNEELSLYSENGLFQHWIQKYIDRRFTRDATPNTHRQPKIVKLKSIIGIIEICGALLLVSVAVFLLELLSVRFPPARTIIDFFTY